MHGHRVPGVHLAGRRDAPVVHLAHQDAGGDAQQLLHLYPAPHRQAIHAVFVDDGLELVGALVLPDEADLIVNTWWSPRVPVDHDVTAFYQVLQGGRRVAGSDAPLGQGWLTVPYWRVGDQVREERRLAVPGGYVPSRHQVIVGLYRPPSIERISARLPDGSAADHVVLRDAATR